MVKTPKTLFVIEAAKVIKGKSSKALKPDSDGYYKGIPAFVLGAVSDNKTRYDEASCIKATTDPKSNFYKTLTTNTLFGEWGHPDIDPKRPDMQRLLKVSEKETSHHIRALYGAERTDEGHLVVRMDIKPCGPYGKEHEEALRDPALDQCYSLRAVAQEKIDPRTGIRDKFLRYFVTVDAVGRGGFLDANSRFIDGQDTGSLECIITPENFLDEEGGYVLEEIKDKDILNIFGAKELVIATKTIGLKLPGMRSYINHDGNKQSSFHAILGHRGEVR